MDITYALFNNLTAIPTDFSKSILQSKENGKISKIPIEQNGFSFLISFEWIDDHLRQFIKIVPKYDYISEGVLDIKINEQYYRNWEKFVPVPFLVDEVIIDGFNNKNSINFLKIFGDDKVSFRITNTVSAMDIENASSVHIEDVAFNALKCVNVLDLKLVNVGGAKQDSSANLTDCKQVWAQNINLSELRVSGLSRSLYFNLGGIHELRLIESSFDSLSLVNCQLHNFFIVLSNPKKLGGVIAFGDCALSGLLSIRQCSIGSPTGFSKIWQNLLKQESRSPIFLNFMDNWVTPSSIELKEVDWHYNGIYENYRYTEGKRMLLNKAKKYYVANDDILNTQLLYSFEKNWYYLRNKWSVPLILSKWSNNFGLNLWWPLLWMLFFIFVETMIILKMAGHCDRVLFENWGVFSYLLNPAHKTNIFINIMIDKGCGPTTSYLNWLPVVDNIGRILIGYCIFQFANAFRYKFKLR